MNTLGQLINQYAPVSAQALAEVESAGEIFTLSKNKHLFKAQLYDAFEYFQLEGIAHRYNTDDENQPITTGIYSGPVVLTPHFARTRGGFSIFSVQALTDCTYFKVPIGTFDELRKNNKQIHAFGQRVVEQEFTTHLRFEVLFRSYSAKNRLLFFREHYPMLENLIPHTVIASYLGITPVSFSRLRNELAKK